MLHEMSKQKKMPEIQRTVIPFYLEMLDAIAKENNGYLAFGRVSTGSLSHREYF